MSRLGAIFATLAMVALTSAPSWGQFQEPTKEELQMTSDAKAPGAKAVYLLVEDDQDDLRNTRIYYQRIKILTEKGKETATVRFKHDPGVKFEVEGRTIHADGKVIPLIEKPADLVEIKTKDMQVNTLTFTMPDAEVGSILEFRVKFKYPVDASYYPSWFIQQDMFVHRAHYSYNSVTQSFEGLTFASRLGPGVKVVSKKNLFTLDVSDVAAFPAEDWMPPLNTFKWRVLFFYSRFATNQEYWKWKGDSWAYFVREFTDPTGTLKKAVAELASPTDSETVKARKIYAAVMKLENTDFTREKTKTERKKEKIKDIYKAQDVWRDRSGNGDEIALLFIALCRAAGLNVVPMKVMDRSRAMFDDALWNGDQLDDYIAVAQLEGKEVFLDPGERMCPFGSLEWKHALSTGLRLTDKTGAIAVTPPLSYKDTKISRFADLTVDFSGAVHGTARLLMQGQQSLHWRQIALENGEDEVKKQFNEWMQEFLPEGVQGEFDHFSGLEADEADLVANVSVDGNLGTITGKHIFLPAMFFESRKHPFVTQETRETPVDVHYPQTEKDDVVYHLPDGYAMEVNVKPNTIYWPDHAQLTISMNASERGVEVVRNLAYGFTMLEAKDYGHLHEFYQKVAASDQQQITLAKAAVVKAGN